MESQHMFDNLLASINWMKAAENSYANFHVEGLSYLNLLRTPRLTVKLYFFECLPHNAQGFLVHPHTHGYNFVHRTMIGSVTNHKFALADGKDWKLYTFATPLNGGNGLSKVMPCGLTELGTQTCEGGDSYYLDHEEIHTVSVQGDYAAAMLLQFHDINPGDRTIMFAPRGEFPDCSSGLYERMTVPHGKRMIEQYNEMLNGGGGDV